MSRLESLGKLLSLPAFALVLLSGCAGGEEKKPDAAKPVAVEKKEKVKKGGKTEELSAATDGVLKGRVVIDGPAPKVEEIAAMQKHNDSKVCLAPDATEAEKSAQTWLLASDGKGVANVVIKLLPPAGKKFKDIPAETKEVVMDQPHCAFVPHVVALTPGQVLVMKNSAAVPHNTKSAVEAGTANENKSVTIPPGQSTTFDLKPQRKPVSLSCDFHPWMTAFAYVNDSPYIAVTDKDGNFEIKNVPTGVELAVVGIHETGDVDGGKEGQKKTFTPGANTLDLKVKVK